MEYVAYFTDATNQYEIIFVDEDGSTVLKPATAYDYGTVASGVVQPENEPTKIGYTFIGWTPEIRDVT